VGICVDVQGDKKSIVGSRGGVRGNRNEINRKRKTETETFNGKESKN